jgi:hypothetical protein
MKNGKSSEKLSDDWTGHWNFTSVRSVDGLDEVANDCKCSGFGWHSPCRHRVCAVRWGRFSSCRMRDCGLRKPARSSWTDRRSRASNLGNQFWGLLARRTPPPQAGLISRLEGRPLRDLDQNLSAIVHPPRDRRRALKPCAERRTASRLTRAILHRTDPAAVH